MFDPELHSLRRNTFLCEAIIIIIIMLHLAAAFI